MNQELIKEAEEVILEAENRAISFIELAKEFEKNLDRSGRQKRKDLDQGVGRLNGVVLPIDLITRKLFIDNYESFYMQSLRLIVKDLTSTDSLNSRKLLLRAIIESVYFYSEPSLVKITTEEKAANRFRYMQVMFFYFLMAKKVGGEFISTYIDFLEVAKENIPAQRLKLFPANPKQIQSDDFSEKNILKCIEDMAKKRSTLLKPEWYDLIYGDMSLLAHGNPFGVVTSGHRAKQKREVCLLLSILLNSLSEVSYFMAKNPDTKPDLKNKLEAFRNDTENFYKNDMRSIHMKLSKAGI